MKIDIHTDVHIDTPCVTATYVIATYQVKYKQINKDMNS